MAKKCMQRREQRRERLSNKYKALRGEMRKLIRDQSSSLDEKLRAQKVMQTIPKNSTMCRRRRRCWKTGRANGVYRIVGLCRNMFRKLAMEGDIPGLHKASW